VLSVRLTKQQYDALATQAKLAGVPTSALARDMILSSLNSGTADVIAAKLEQVLRHTLNPNMLTP
jgi:hypothetical protein